ncbi:hypothetical protein ACFFX0_10325 [Citricoccus parietis]|uniref:Uncharacterized protein n=1 Tax=Citricoccus parietis TaxID=592307 RepID=A0ABV5FY35_9MICC
MCLAVRTPVICAPLCVPAASVVEPHVMPQYGAAAAGGGTAALMPVASPTARTKVPRVASGFFMAVPSSRGTTAAAPSGRIVRRAAVEGQPGQAPDALRFGAQIRPLDGRWLRFGQGAESGP